MNNKNLNHLEMSQFDKKGPSSRIRINGADIHLVKDIAIKPPYWAKCEPCEVTLTFFCARVDIRDHAFGNPMQTPTEEWEPNDGDAYFTVRGNKISEHCWDGDLIDRMLLRSGNTFRTREEAEQAIRKGC